MGAEVSMRSEEHPIKKPMNRQDFLRTIGDVYPEDVGAGSFLKYEQQLLDAVPDIRCTRCGTCPFHHPPSPEVSPPGAKVIWE
jgi:hypothetical protein